MEKKVIFSEQVYAVCKNIPPGKVSTYGDIAGILGCKGYQAIGNALRSNPYAPKVPCHRVVKSTGVIGGFKGEITGKNVIEKINLLRKEGVVVKEGKVDLEIFKHKFFKDTN